VVLRVQGDGSVFERVKIIVDVCLRVLAVRILHALQRLEFVAQGRL
jgi:hypothetical protein